MMIICENSFCAQHVKHLRLQSKGAGRSAEFKCSDYFHVNLKTIMLRGCECQENGSNKSCKKRLLTAITANHS